MSNCYTHSCFVLWITAAECALLREAITFAEFLDEEPEVEFYRRTLARPVRDISRRVSARR